MSLLLIAVLLLTACAEQVAIEPRLKLAGSTTVEPVAAAAAKAFMVTHEGVEISVRGGGSSIGVLGVTHGALHIGMASRELKESELEEMPTLTTTVIGRDGVAVVVNRGVYDGGVTQLTLAQVRDIWLGNINNWQELGGPDLPILAFDKEMGRGTRAVFAEIVLGSADAEAPGTIGALGENEVVLTTVSENEGAISIVSSG
ncbi:MAG: substrate-binding domain-containing protein, partial [Anaerolineae bacterium]